MKISNQKSINLFDLILRTLFVFLVFCISFTMARRLPTAISPDEQMRNRIAYWIFENGALPVGNEFELINNAYGFSYATLPFLPAMVSAVFMKIASFFTSSQSLIFLASRMVSVLSETAIAIVCFMIGDKLFKKKASSYLFALISCFLPQILFISGYFNNDVSALLGAYLIMYFLIYGKETCFNIKSLIGLSVSMAIVILSYYNAYGWIVVSVIFCVFSWLFDKRIENRARFFFSRFSIVFLTTFALAGWFFIRNAVLHNGDFLGRTTCNLIAAEFEKAGHAIHKFSPPKSQGIPVFSMLADGHWVKTVIASFVGVFGNMNISMPSSLYTAYYYIIGAGLVLGVLFAVAKKENYLFKICMAIAGVFPAVLTVIYSYTSDYQPQGRYAMSLLPALAFFITYGFENLDLILEKLFKKAKSKSLPAFSKKLEKYGTKALACVLWAVLFAVAYFGTMRAQLYFHPSLKADFEADNSIISVDYKAADIYSSVRIAVWCETQDNLEWIYLERSDSQDIWNSVSWGTDVNLSKYNKAGLYSIHVYAVDYKGKDQLVDTKDLYLSSAVNRNTVFVKNTESGTEIYMEPKESYEDVTFALWSEGDTEPDMLGARYDSETQRWYVTDNITENDFSQIIAYTSNGTACLGNSTVIIK